MDTYPAGYSMVRAEDTVRGRPVIIDIWYPAMPAIVETPHDYGIGNGCVARDAPAAEGLHPVIILSHGAFGAARNYSWIAGACCSSVS
jgi:predicted dienelactone hydrolase